MKEENIPSGVTNPQTSTLSEEFKRINDLVKDISKLTTYVIVVLLVMVATMMVTVAGIVISTYQNQSASNQNLINQIGVQNAKIDTLTNISNQNLANQINVQNAKINTPISVFKK